MARGIIIQVTCYAGYRGNERPVRFSIGEKEYEVKEIVDRWYGPDYSYFKVRADDGNSYIIKYDEAADEWELEFFRKGDSP
jgi:hypothetical protein